MGGFTSLGTAPGISGDGRVVVFTGNRGKGPGVFAVYLTGGAWSKPVRIAGEGVDGFTAFDPTSAVQVGGSLGDETRGLTVAFVGTHTGNSLAPAEGVGLYTCRLSFYGKSLANFDPDNVQSVLVNGVEQVAKIGDTLPDGATITGIRFWHGIDSKTRGTLTFWVQTNHGQEIVQAKPWQVVWLDFNPTTTNTVIVSPANSALLAKVGIGDQSGWGGSTQSALSNLGLPANYDYNALETAVVNEVQDQFTKAGARIKVTAVQPAEIPETARLPVGPSVVEGAYKTIYIGGAPAQLAKAPSGEVLGKASQVDYFNQEEDDTAVVFVDEIVNSSGFGGQPITNQTYLVNGLADTIAHEAGHTFGLFHLDRSLSAQLMHGGTNAGEFGAEQVFSAAAYPTYYEGDVHTGIVESSAARLKFAAGSTGSATQNGGSPPATALLALVDPSAADKAGIDFPAANSLTVADLLVGVVSPDGDTMPTFQDLGGGDLATLLNNANILVGPDDSLLVIGSTDGKSPDIVAVAQGQDGAQNSLSLTQLGVMTDDRLVASVSGSGAAFHFYQLAPAGATDLGTGAIQLSSVNPAPLLTLAASNPMPIAGQPLTLTATVTPSASGGAHFPPWTVQFNGRWQRCRKHRRRRWSTARRPAAASR